MSIPCRVAARRITVVALSIAVLGGCALFDRPVPFRTAEGRESPDILAGLSGRIAIDAHLASSCYALRTVDPALRQRCIPHADEGTGRWVAAIAPDGPTSVLRMRMAYQPGPAADVVRLPIDVTLETVTYCGRTGQPCPGTETIATWTRSPGMNLYHQTLSLSPDGRFAAIVPDSHLLRGPGDTGKSSSTVRFRGQRLVGALKIVDLRAKTIRDAGIEVTDAQPISWSRDGRRLLLVRAEPVDRLPPALAAQVTGDEGRPGQGVPVIETFDLQTNATTMLAIGQQPVWSPDERTVLYQPADDHVALFDIADGNRRPIVLPGMSTRYEPIAIAFVAPRRILYWGLPTAGTEPQFTSNNSPLVGPKQLVSLKVADLDSGAFATVVPDLDPRADVGFRADRP